MLERQKNAYPVRMTENSSSDTFPQNHAMKKKMEPYVQHTVENCANECISSTSGVN